MPLDPTPEPCSADPALHRSITMLAQYRRMVKRDEGYLRSLTGCCRGETIFCLGNGPSLLRQNPELLAGMNVISTNHGFRFLQDAKPARVWNLITDTGRLREVGPDLAAGGQTTWIAPYRVSEEWLELADRWPSFRVMPTTQFIRWTGETWELAARDTPLCSFRLPDELEHCGFSVIFAAIQLAVYFGARTVVLLGVDMDYSGGKSHFAPGVSHLNSTYDYETHARSVLVHFQRTMAAMGCGLLNATDGGRIDVLDRVSLSQSVALSQRDATENRKIGVTITEWVHRGTYVPGQTGPLLRDPQWLTSRRLGKRTELEERLMLILSDTCGRGTERRQLLIWGAGSGGRRVLGILTWMGGGADGFIDSDPDKAGGVIEGIPVMPPPDIPSNAFVLIASISADVIRSRLEQAGLLRDQDYYQVDFTAVQALEMIRYQYAASHLPSDADAVGARR